MTHPHHYSLLAPSLGGPTCSQALRCVQILFLAAGQALSQHRRLPWPGVLLPLIALSSFGLEVALSWA